ncbi:MAG: hypothetical protein ACYDEN_05230 [Acidimicrobiales bacterium]
MAPLEPTTRPADRWVRVLDRMEHRRADVGLRFWAPPLWLEVTMTGPDSDRWPLAGGPDQEWNWQSSEPCLEATELAEAGAGDERLLAVVSRYAVENLILNAVHEIGEWFRLDGRRVFPAHPGRVQPDDDHPVYDDVDGNGPVRTEVGFPATSLPGAALPEPSVAQAGVAARVAATVAASRFSYLPGTSISYGALGPVVTGPDGPAAAWHGVWSPDVLQAGPTAVAAGPADHPIGAAAGPADHPIGAGPADHLTGAVASDVHRALVHYEADRVCRAFHVDGHRVWFVASDRPPLRAADDPADSALEPLTITITHAGEELLGRSTARPSMRLANR